ncbi:OLC1v1018849C1 [Oldenlandia corymbosa var. corymbosa]|uniref:OLC1v1018849C1 n=1 Tax=Oldenlandia corymbosa var. corymbosa TaxID=529605 RepID=A0AAV1ECY7_OLDCO|nr:OLC1v1018849C1 [Oldenlandia corymbosa var. corymbosa]
MNISHGFLKSESHYLECYHDDNYVEETESFEAEIEKWYITLLDCMQQSSSPMTNQVMDVVDSVMVNLEDVCLKTEYYDLDCSLLEPTEALKEIITFLRNFFRVATLSGSGEPQELQAFLTHIEALAIKAAQVRVRLFLYHKEASYHDETKRMISAFLHEMKHVDTRVYDTYTRVLTSLKHSISDLHVLTISLGNDPLVFVNDFLVSLISMFWEMLQSETLHWVSLKDQLIALYEGLRFLRSTLKENPNKFIDNNRVIRIGVEGQVLQTSQFSFPKTNVLGVLDYLLGNMVEVRNRKVDSYIQAFYGDSPSEGNEIVLHSSFGMPSLLCRPIKEERMDLDYLCDRELVQESYDQVDENVINFGVQTKGDDSLMEISAQGFQ